MRSVALLIAAIIAVVAGVFALNLSSKRNQPVDPNQQAAAQQGPAVTTVEVLVARSPIEVGTIIEESMIDRQPWPSHLVLDGFITVGSKDSNLVGRVARASFQASEPITRNKVANPNDPSFLAANLPEGMRAITMATDAVSGVAGYVFPGDRVDIVITHNIPQEMESRAGRNVMRVNNKPDVSEVLVADVRVLAVNVRQPTGKEAASSTPSSITLEVAEKDVQEIRLAEKVATLSLSLRPLKDKKDASPQPVQSGALTHVNSYGGDNMSGVRIVRGAGDKQDRSSDRPPMGAPMMDAPPPSPQGQ